MSKMAISCVKPSAHLQILNDSHRIISHEGRSGLHFTSIRGRAAVPSRGLRQPAGTLAFWVLPLQDFSPATQYKNHGLSNRFFDRFVFLSDQETIQDLEVANFKVFYTTAFYPGLRVELERGAQKHWRRTGAQTGHFEMPALKWHHLAVTWDRPHETCALYANGVKVAVQDVTKTEPYNIDPPGPRLFFGNPSYAMGDISFHDSCLDDRQVAEIFQGEATRIDERVQKTLRRSFLGEGLPDFVTPDFQNWDLKMDLSLTRDEDYHEFYHQGCANAVNVTGNGLRIKTPTIKEYFSMRAVSGMDGSKANDVTRMYLWTRKAFEGDLCVTVDFKIHQPGGLALLILQAAGMQGEDFLEDYPRRSDGAMSMICWEDVRNYHWEFYREMTDARNDFASHLLVKNPWFRDLAYQVENCPWELDRWYRLSCLQEGSRLRGAVDDVTVFDVMDTGFDNNGPVLKNGHVALRCMMRTDLTFRNFKIWSKEQFKVG